MRVEAYDIFAEILRNLTDDPTINFDLYFLSLQWKNISM